MDLGIDNKNAIVTGSSRGIGKAISLALAREGVNVAIHYNKSQNKAEKLVEQIKKMGVESFSIQADISNPQQCMKMMNNVTNIFGKLDILINNAGVFLTNWVKDIPLEEWNKVFDTNLTSAFLTSKYLVNHSLENNYQAKILNINSHVSFNGSTSGHAHYAASKGGMSTFTVSLAREVANKGINVNEIAVGVVNTDMTKEILKQNKQNYLNRIPINRIAEPEDIADIAVFLVSEKVNYVTGATFDASGGMLMR